MTRGGYVWLPDGTGHDECGNCALILAEIAYRLAEAEDVDPAAVRIGPVDFGNEHNAAALNEEDR